MVALVHKGCTEARARNSKKVTAAHLKSALMQDEQFDFVTDICKKIPDPSEKKKGVVKSEAGDSDDVMSDGEEGAVKKRKGKGKGS